MTANELRKYLNDNYGVSKEWPRTFEVDAETYANCCQEIFNHIVDDSMEIYGNENHRVIDVYVGRSNNGLMFKNVELIYKTKK